MAATIPSTECTPIARTGTADTAAPAWGSATVPAMAMAIARMGTADTAAPAWGSVSASDAVGINARIEPRSSGPRLSYVGIGRLPSVLALEIPALLEADRRLPTEHS